MSIPNTASIKAACSAASSSGPSAGLIALKELFSTYIE